MFTIRLTYILLLVWSLILYKKLSRSFKWVAIMIWLTILHETIAFVLKRVELPNTFGSHIYSIALVPLFYIIYDRFLKQIPGWPWIRFVYFVVFLFCILNSIFVQSTKIIPSYNLNALSLVVIASSLLFYLKMLKEPISSPIQHQSQFWLNTAILFYHSSSFVIFSLTNHFHLNNYSLSQLKYMNIIMCCVYYPALGYSLWLNAKEMNRERSK